MEQLGQFVVNHWGLWLALAVILLLIFINELLSQKKKAKELTPTAAVGLINHEDAAVIDLRDKETYRAGHIINAVQASEDDFNKEKMSKYKKKPFILVCSRGLQASALAAKLREQGYEHPHTLAGGMAAWTAANLPVVKGKGKK